MPAKGFHMSESDLDETTANHDTFTEFEHTSSSLSGLLKYDE